MLFNFTRDKDRIILILVFLFIFAAANLDAPEYWNKAADFLNSRLQQAFGGQAKIIPHFFNMPFRLGLDLQGGTHLVYETDLSKINKPEWSQSLQGLRDVIDRRVNLFGVQEPVVQIEETSQRLIVELAGIKDVNQAIEMIGKTPYLEFKEERNPAETQQILDKQKEVEGKSFEEIQNIPDWQIAFEDPYFVPTKLTGQYLGKASLDFDPNTNRPQVGLEFNDEGARIFKELTEKNIGKRLAIYLDQSPISAPTVQEAISGGRAQITGDFTIQEARETVRNLNAGALPVPIKLISQKSIGASLGEISLKNSLRAGLFAFLAVALFMIAWYRLPGVLAVLALIFYAALVLAIFKLIPVTLTLAGIAGFILSIGVAVDANILIFARMREEFRKGRNFLGAVNEGFARAWPSIRDSNVSALITSAILYFFTTGAVKGFALTFGIGVIVSMFSAIFITRLFLKLFIGSPVEKFNWLWYK